MSSSISIMLRSSTSMTGLRPFCEAAASSRRAKCVAALRRRVAVLDLVVKRQAAHGGHARGVAAAEPVQHVDVVRALLQQQAGALRRSACQSLK